MTPAAPRTEPAVPELRAWGRSNTLWLVVSLAMLALLAGAAWLVVADDTDQPVPPFLRAGGTDPAPSPVSRPEGEGLRLAGSGSNLPITRSLSTAFPREVSLHPVVHASIGSGGGIQALLDGVIDIALVSRPLKDGEAEQGLVATPYARVPVVVAVHASVVDTDISREQLLAIFGGEQRTWSNGVPIVVLQRERGDSSHSAIARVLPRFADINEVAYRDEWWRVLYRDDSMREALADTRGAVGLFGEGGIPPGVPIHALAIDGVMPTIATLASGEYPFYKDLAFVTRGPPRGEAAALIDFALSPEGRRIIEQGGALPLGSGSPRRPSEDD